MNARTKPSAATRCSCVKEWKTVDGVVDFDVIVPDPFCTANHGGRV